MQVESITRNMAVFIDVEDVEEIMPIRSARSYFVSTALAYDAIYVHAGESGEGNEFAYTFLKYYVDNDRIDFTWGDFSKYHFRHTEDPYYSGEHSLATTGENLTQAFAQAGTRMEHSEADFDYGLHFTEDAAPTDGSVANTIRVVFPGNKITNFTYKGDQKGYSLNQNNTDLTDKNNDELVIFQNVLVLGTAVKTNIDYKGHSSVATTNCEGKGIFFNGGYCEPITWSRGEYNEPFHYYHEDGTELELGVGRTYIAFVSDSYGGATYQ